MTSDLDIYRTTSVLIREHGEEADLEAAWRADAVLEKGSLDGQRVWKRVLAAIKDIQRQEGPRADRRLHHDQTSLNKRLALNLGAGHQRPYRSDKPMWRVSI